MSCQELAINNHSALQIVTHLFSQFAVPEHSKSEEFTDTCFKINNLINMNKRTVQHRVLNQIRTTRHLRTEVLVPYPELQGKVPLEFSSGLSPPFY